MSEPGEIAANKEPDEKAKMNINDDDDGDDAEEGELVEAAAIEEDKNDESASNDVVAQVVQEMEDAAAEEEPKTNDGDKEEGEISPSKDPQNKAPEAAKPAEEAAAAETKPDTETQATVVAPAAPDVPSEKPKEDEKEAAIALLAAAPADAKVEDTTENAASTAPAPAVEAAMEIMAMKEEAAKEKEGEIKEEDSAAAKPDYEITASKETENEAAVPPSETATVPAAAAVAPPEPTPDKMEEEEEAAEAGEIEEGEVEDGEVEEGQLEEAKPEEKDVVEKEEVKEKEAEEPTEMEIDEPKVEVQKEPEKEAPAPMKVDDEPEPQPAETETKATATSDEDGEIKEDTDEDGEIKETIEGEGEIKEDASEEEEKEQAKQDEIMEEAKTSSEEKPAPDETPDPYADTASTDGDTASVADDKPSYSTRGRASGTASGTATPVPRDLQAASGKSSKVAGSVGGSSEQWERSVREALEDLSRGGKDGVPSGVGTGGTSFLEALGEEERRTRTRFLPAVDGIHQLRKTEIKSDLALARSIMSQSGNVTSVASVAGTANPSVAKKPSKTKKNKHEGEPEAMDTDDNGASTPTEDDLASEVGVRVGNAANIQVTSNDVLAVPSTAFIPPPAATLSVTSSAANGEKKDDGAPPAPVISTGIKEILNNQGTIKSPKVIESVSAFNPPRPPESAGKKKQHRMLRWERRPADVEVDLNNYRKTVDRTRKELHTAEAELERIENTSNHLRRHFLGHLKCMDQESDVIMEELGTVQQQCVSAADLLTSRTRSRGAGKGSYVMKDVIGVLKARGAELSEKGLSLQADFLSDVAQSFPGVGGVSAGSFSDWDQHTVITPHRIASAWILPDDIVQTPGGEGKVLKVFKASSLDVKAPALTGTHGTSQPNGASPSKMDVDQPQKAKSSPAPGDKKKAPPPASADLDSSQEFATMLAPRVCVRLPYGVGYFSAAVVTSKACANTLTDAVLVKRWKSIMETSTMVAGQLDQAGMALVDTVAPKGDDVAESSEKTSDEVGSTTNGGGAPMELENAANGSEKAVGGNVESAKGGKDPSKLTLLPFGSGLIPTVTGRGSHLAEMDIHTLQKGIQPALSEGKGVLGDKANEGVPVDVKKFEGQRQESYILQAKVLHLRNQLYRQRRIRALNERTFAATKERSVRVENLVAEMRTDLKSLKNRLDEELKELGIDHDAAEAILKEYYLAHDYDDAEEEDEDDGEDLGQKRSRDSYDNDDRSADAEQLTEEERQAKRTKISSQ